MSLAADLPIDILKLIMQHVPVKQRLSSCALVCQKFRAAAVAATEHIEATLSERLAVDHLATYLQQHGGHLTSLKLTGDRSGGSDWPELEQLPCQHLQELHLINWNLRCGPDQGLPDILSHTTALTRLELLHVRLRGSAAALAFPPSLQHLCVDGSWFVDDDRFDTDSIFVWETLQHLTHLDLVGLRVGADSLGHISSMTDLRVLVVHDGDCRMVHAELQLPASLQHLEFTGVLGPSVLAAATQLTCLILDEGQIEGEGGVSGGACLLEVLPKLRHLVTLRLEAASINWPPPSPAYQAFLASSSKLRVLHVNMCEMPDGALAHIFPSASSHNIALTSCCLEDIILNDTPWDADVVASLVGCCPALLQLGMDSKGSADLAALSQLSALSRLYLFLKPEDDGSVGAGPAVSIQSLAGLTRLQHLCVWHGTRGGMRFKDLLPLTTLRRLTELQSNCHQTLDIKLKTQAGPGQPPDVWLKLLERCVADSECQPVIIRNLTNRLLQREATNSQQQQELTDLRQQLAEQYQQLAEQRQHNARLQLHVTDLQQQQLKDRQQVQAQQQHNTEVQEQLASQGGLLCELQAQVQELLSLQRL